MRIYVSVEQRWDEKEDEGPFEYRESISQEGRCISTAEIGYSTGSSMED